MAIFRGNGGSVEGITESDTVVIAISQGGTGATTASGARSNLGLGTAATTNSTAYATAAQGALADSALQSESDPVFSASEAASITSTDTTNWDTAYTDRLKWDGGSTGLNASTGRTSLGLGTAATTASTDYATAAQGSLADSAVQPGDLATVATSGSYNDLSNKPTIPTDLNSLTDVVITTPSTNQVLQYNGTNWVNATGGGGGSGTVTSVDMSVPTGLAVSGNPITSSGTLAVTYASGYSIPTTTKQTEWDTAYTDRLKWDGGSTGLTASTGRTSLGATTVGSNLFTLTNPSAVTFPRFNADNTVSSLSASDFRTAIGAGTSSTTGTVTSITAGTGLSGGTITTSGTIALENTSVTAGSYTAANITVDAQGRITSASNGSGGGGVTSVTGTSPIVSSGGTTPAISLASGYGDTQNPYASKTANFVLAAPDGASGAPTFRAIVAADIPTLNQNTTGTASNVTGTVAIANGGTGQTTANSAYNALNPMTTTGDMVYEASGGIATRLPIGTTGQVLTVSGGLPTWSAAAGGGFPSGTAMLFAQTNAPTGWTKSTTHNDKALRVVSGTASSGGSVAFTTAFASGLSSGATTLTTTQMPSHNHTYQGVVSGSGCAGGPSGGSGSYPTYTTSSTGGGGSHTHTLPSFAVSYVDVIIATQN